LVACLFKADAYFAALLAEPPSLNYGDLDVQLTATYSIWNAHGLHIFSRRIPEEPLDRIKWKMSALCSHPQSVSPSLLLIEDIHLGLCAMIPRVQQYREACRNSSVENITLNPDTRTALLGELVLWKNHLDAISFVIDPENSTNTSQNPIVKAYYGDEESDSPMLLSSVLARVRSIMLETTMLYHLLSLGLCADVLNIKDWPAVYSNAVHLGSNNHKFDVGIAVGSWARSTDGAQAFLHAITILGLYVDALGRAKPKSDVLDPIDHIAGSKASQVAAAYMQINPERCGCEFGTSFVPIDANNMARTNPTTQHWLKTEVIATGINSLVCRCAETI
jgi:hypothetical protein